LSLTPRFGRWPCFLRTLSHESIHVITGVNITNFQSLVKADLDLGKLTVIVGPSSSGKSAFLRALRILARNTSGPAHVTYGATASAVTAEFDGHKVALERGKGVSLYRTWKGGIEEIYPKSGTSVPDEVGVLLKMPIVEGEDLCFAFQFDKPFLLDETGSTIAKVLGDLTNVNLLLESAREANRRRLEVQAKLKVRKADYAKIQTQIPEILAARAAAARLDGVREDIAVMRVLAKERQELDWSLEAVALVARASAQLDEIVDLPDLQPVFAKADKVRSLRDSLSSAVLQIDDFRISECDEALVQLDVHLLRIEEEHAQILHDSGTCPLCGAKT